MNASDMGGLVGGIGFVVMVVIGNIMYIDGNRVQKEWDAKKLQMEHDEINKTPFVRIGEGYGRAQKCSCGGGNSYSQETGSFYE